MNEMVALQMKKLAYDTSNLSIRYISCQHGARHQNESQQCLQVSSARKTIQLKVRFLQLSK